MSDAFYHWGMGFITALMLITILKGLGVGA